MGGKIAGPRGNRIWAGTGGFARWRWKKKKGKGRGEGPPGGPGLLHGQRGHAAHAHARVGRPRPRTTQSLGKIERALQGLTGGDRGRNLGDDGRRRDFGGRRWVAGVQGARLAASSAPTTAAPACSSSVGVPGKVRMAADSGGPGRRRGGH
jgi:hypothetical protein